MAVTNNLGVVYFNKFDKNLQDLENAVGVYAPVYGVEWINDTSTTMTRTDNAAGKSAILDPNTKLITSDFDNLFPWNETTIITDNSGNKFLRFPTMWFRMTKDSNGDLNSVAVSKEKGAGNNWYKCCPFDFGIYPSSFENNKMRSVSGVTPSGQAYYNLRNYAQANTESGYVYHTLDLTHRNVLAMLWWIEFATKNSKEIVNTTYPTGGYTTGTTDTLSVPSGFSSNGQFRWHYIEDFICTSTYIEGVYCTYSNSSVAYYATDNPSKFNTTTGKPTIYTSTANSEGSIVALTYRDNYPLLFLPSKIVTSTDYVEGFCNYCDFGTFYTSYNYIYSLQRRGDFGGLACGGMLYQHSTSNSNYNIGRLVRQPNTNTYYHN